MTGGDQLTLLQHLAQLHTLEVQCISEPDLELQGLHALRKLVLYACSCAVCNISSLTQLTSFEILDVSETIMLPAGPKVYLHLEFWSQNDGGYFGALHNLQDATLLTSIMFHCTYPLNLQTFGWPPSMPSLQVMNVNQMPHGPPEQLTAYSDLRELDMVCHFMDGQARRPLPDWFSRLTQLERLRVTTDDFSEFPTCLLHLKQLRSLDLSDNGLYALQLPDSIFQFSEFTALTHLDLRNSRRSVPTHWEDQARDQLVRLKDMLRPGGPDILHY